jgi:hypothetical protein
VDTDTQGNGVNNYTVIQFFENWISYIVNEQFTSSQGNPGIEDPNYTYRVKYPRGNDGYKSSAIYINKFERDFNGRFLQYRLIHAYPIAINSMPVSYDQSSLLKCSISFNYERYLVTTNPNLPLAKPGKNPEEPKQSFGDPGLESAYQRLNETERSGIYTPYNNPFLY